MCIYVYVYIYICIYMYIYIHMSRAKAEAASSLVVSSSPVRRFRRPTSLSSRFSCARFAAAA